MVVVRYHLWQHGAQRADKLVRVANLDCVHILHQRVLHGHEVHSVIRHAIGLHLGEDVGDEALEVSVLRQCRMGSNAGFLGEIRIFQYLTVLPCHISQVRRELSLHQLTHELLIHEPQATQPPRVMFAFLATVDGNNSSCHEYLAHFPCSTCI